VPKRARIRVLRGSRFVAVERSHVSPAAASAALRTPTFASASWVPWKASDAMRSETVKPIPAIVPPPATDAHPTGGRSRPLLMWVASQVEATIPTGLPTT